MNASSILSYGFIPISFPRDPVDFNQFDEHVAFGQVIESLVDADGDGKIVPAISNEWHFSKNGQEIYFQIDPNKKFSNGQSVKPEDVVYSLQRHLNSNSQSNYFLSDIRDLKVTGKNQLTVYLKRNNPLILKALTRDQLGILPANWIFKKDSDSPYIGTGPYVLKKNDNDWYFESNPFYEQSKISIKKWKLVFYKDANLSIPTEIPSVAPYLTKGALDQLKKSNNIDFDKITADPILSFMQTSFWVHPKGTIFNNKNNRTYIQRALSQVIDEFCINESLSRATGLIPKGIQGSLDKFAKFEREKRRKYPLKIKVASLAGGFAKLFSEVNLKNIHEKYNIEIDLKFFTFVEMAKIQQFNPDIITGSWAGGFNDPTGFLALLGPLLGEEFKKYLGPSLGEQLSYAEVEQDLNKRTIAFQKIANEIISQGLLIPGWRINVFEVKSNLIKNKKFQTRYTPRLINYEYLQ